MTEKYAISNDSRHLAAGGPLNMEYYGPAWAIAEAGSSCSYATTPLVIVPDPGDGSAAALAAEILRCLNGAAGYLNRLETKPAPLKENDSA